MNKKLDEILENMSKDLLISSFKTLYEESVKKDLEIERLNNIINSTINYIDNMSYAPVVDNPKKRFSKDIEKS